MDGQREMLRHSVATLAYRSAKALRGAPASFSDFPAGVGPRTVGKIVAHMGDLMDWALSMANGKHEWHNSNPLPWEKEVERFFAALKKFDDFLTSSEPVHAPLEKLFQGPIADGLTHVGQIAMLRRLAGDPVKAENFYKAEITTGRVGADQAKPKFEF
jgi:hypothetical protein